MAALLGQFIRLIHNGSCFETFAPYPQSMFRRLRKLTVLGPYRSSTVQDEESLRLAEELARRLEEQQRAA